MHANYWRARGILAVWIALFLLSAVPSWAVDFSDIWSKGGNDKGVEPSKAMPRLPTPPETPKPQSTGSFFPDLPPSHVCKQDDLYGVWELQQVYEAPPGTEAQGFVVNPVQYLIFEKDTRFYRYNAGRVRMKGPDVQNKVREHAGNVLQYLLQDAGMLYIYRDSVASEVQVCFVVVTTRPPFPEGNMLLLPPKGNIQGRLVKEYKKIWPTPPPPKHAPPPVRR